MASVANGDGGEFAHYLIAPDGKITQVTRFEDKCIAAVAGPDDNLYLISRKDAPRGKLLRMQWSRFWRVRWKSLRKVNPCCRVAAYRW